MFVFWCVVQLNVEALQKSFTFVTMEDNDNHNYNNNKKDLVWPINNHTDCSD